MAWFEWRAYMLTEVRFLCSKPVLLRLLSKSLLQLLDSWHSLLDFFYAAFTLCLHQKESLFTFHYCILYIFLKHRILPLICSSISHRSWSCRYFTVSVLSLRPVLWSPENCCWLLRDLQVCQISAKHVTHYITFQNKYNMLLFCNLSTYNLGRNLYFDLYLLCRFPPLVPWLILHNLLKRSQN